MRGHAKGPFDRQANLRVQAVLICLVGIAQTLYVEASPTNPVLVTFVPNVDVATSGGTDVILVGTPTSPNAYYASGDIAPGTPGLGTVKKFVLIANTTIIASLTSVAIAASGVLTISAITSADTQTVTIGGQTYTFHTSLSGFTTTPNAVLIGADTTAMAANLAAAINAGAGAGTTYGTGTVANASVSAVAALGVVTLAAKTAGTVGNAIATTETLSNGAFGAATLAGGSNPSTVGQITLFVDA